MFLLIVKILFAFSEPFFIVKSSISYVILLAMLVIKAIGIGIFEILL